MHRRHLFNMLCNLAYVIYPVNHKHAVHKPKFMFYTEPARILNECLSGKNKRGLHSLDYLHRNSLDACLAFCSPCLIKKRANMWCRTHVMQYTRSSHLRCQQKNIFNQTKGSPYPDWTFLWDDLLNNCKHMQQNISYDTPHKNESLPPQNKTRSIHLLDFFSLNADIICRYNKDNITIYGLEC